MKVRFVRAFDYTPSLRRQVSIAYKAGWSGTVKRECGEAAVAAGAAVEINAEIKPAPEVRNDEGPAGAE